MVRLKVIMAITGAVLLLFPLLALAGPWDSRPWQEAAVLQTRLCQPAQGFLHPPAVKPLT